MCSEEPDIHSIRPVGRMFLLGDMAICWARCEVRTAFVGGDAPCSNPSGSSRLQTHSCHQLLARRVGCRGYSSLWLHLRGRRVSGAQTRPARCRRTAS